MADPARQIRALLSFRPVLGVCIGSARCCNAKRASTVKVLERSGCRRMEALTLDYLNSDYRRPLRPALGKRGANRAWEWIIGAGAILLFIALASAFVSYEPIQPPCGPSCSMKGTSWHPQSVQNKHPLELKLGSNQNPSPTREIRV